MGDDIALRSTPVLRFSALKLPIELCTCRCMRPLHPRYVWPKISPALSERERAISDDWMHFWHQVLPKRYGSIERFNHGYPLKYLPDQPYFRTIEIGAGSGGHLEFEDLSRQEYHCVELRENMSAEIKRRFPAVTVMTGSCQDRMPYANNYFDRAIAVHVLEHLPDLPRAIGELHRLLRVGGILAIVIPCDPGVAYEFARQISSARIFRRRYKMPYMWLMRREHINSPAEINSELRSGFEEIDRTYFPLGFVPITTANLCLGLTFRRR
jgi:SAM-dependent methyltransferase